MLLRQNNQVMIQKRAFYRFCRPLWPEGNSAPRLSAGAAALPNRFSVQIVQLKFVGAADVQRILAPYAADLPMSPCSLTPCAIC